MKHRDYFGDDRLAHYTEKDKNTISSCIYCGNYADTREHSPSKVFLDKPYPNELPITPSCSACNNSFSHDELSVSMLVEVYKTIYNKADFSDKFCKRINKFPNIFYSSYFGIKNSPKSFYTDKITRVLVKLAIGHSVFELTRCYPADLENCKIEVSYQFLPNMNQIEIDNYNRVEKMDLFPEIGSRAFAGIATSDEQANYMYAMEVNASSGKNEKSIRFLFTDWIDVQEDKYRYICFHRDIDIVVKIAISEFLYGTVVFKYN